MLPTPSAAPDRAHLSKRVPPIQRLSAGFGQQFVASTTISMAGDSGALYYLMPAGVLCGG